MMRRTLRVWCRFLLGLLILTGVVLFVFPVLAVSLMVYVILVEKSLYYIQSIGHSMLPFIPPPLD